MTKDDTEAAENAWKSPLSFQCGRWLYTPTEISEVTGDMRLGPRSGTLQEWTAAANHLFAKGMEPYSLAVIASFAAPLLKMVGDGAILISLFGPRRNALVHDAIASVWGHKDALREGGNLPVLNDNVTSRDPDLVRAFLDTLAKEQATFVIASGDIPLKEIAGEHPRVIEFEAPAHRGSKSVYELKSDLRNNAGHAGDAFLQRLIQPETMRFLQGAIPNWKHEVWQQTGLSKDREPWVNAITAITAACVMVHNLALISFSPNRIIRWLVDQVKVKHHVPAYAYDPCDLLVEFINSHIRGLLIVPRQWQKGMKPMEPLMRPAGELQMRYEVDTGRLYIWHTPMNRFVRSKLHINRAEFIAGLIDRGVMLSDRVKITLGAATGYSSWQVFAYLVDARHPALKGLLIPNYYPG